MCRSLEVVVTSASDCGVRTPDRRPVRHRRVPRAPAKSESDGAERRSAPMKVDAIDLRSWQYVSIRHRGGQKKSKHPIGTACRIAP